MPELPEVETIVQELRKIGIIGLTIERVIIFWERSLANILSKAFCQRIAHQTIVDLNRKGKFLVFTLSKDTLFVHLRMTGKFLIDQKQPSPNTHERIRLYLSDGRTLRYEDQRKFGKWYLTHDPQPFLDKIGLEPLSPSFSLAAFKNLLRGKHRKIKPFLLDQKFIAGIGNIYADEALWEAKIHPVRSLDSLSAKEIAALHQAIILVLKAGVANIGTSLGAARANYFSVSGRRGTHQYQLKVFRRDGLPCPRCHVLIKKISLAQRGTHFCPSCQI